MDELEQVGWMTLLKGERRLKDSDFSESRNLIVEGNCWRIPKETGMCRTARFCFYNEHDLAKFNSYFAAIQQISQEQSALQQSNLQNINQRLD